MTREMKRDRVRHVILGALLVLLALGLPAGTPAQDEADDDYRIGTDDRLSIQVWQRPGLSGEYVVDEQGNLNLPLVGTIRARGMTALELRTDLERRMVILDPGITQVLVTVTEFNSRRFTVVGEVRSPGVYRFRELPTLWEVILLAGGATSAADMSGVQIRRETPDGPARTITVDLSAGLEGTPEEDLPVLEPEDTIVIPSRLGTGVSGDQVQVLGSVRAPGPYPVRVAGTVVEAITVSGGHTENADLGHVRLTRRDPAGGTISYDLDLDGYLKGGYPGTDLELRPGDTVLVPAKGGISVLRVVQISSVVSATAALIIALNAISNN